MKRYFLTLSVAGLFALAACNNAAEEPTSAQPQLSEKQQLAVLARAVKAFESRLQVHPAPELIPDFKGFSLSAEERSLYEGLTQFRAYATKPSATWQEAQRLYDQLLGQSKATQLAAYTEQVAAACYLNVLVKDAAAPADQIRQTLDILHKGKYRDSYLFARGLQKVWTLEKNRPAQLDDIRSYAIRVATEPTAKTVAEEAAIPTNGNMTSVERALQQMYDEAQQRMEEKSRQNQAEGLRILQSL